MIKFIVSLIILFSVGVLYDKYKQKQEKKKYREDYSLVRKYLMNNEALKEGKPIIWIHLDYEINSRNWLNFGSRNTRELNENYKYITIKSIINKSNGNFNVCLIDDNSFEKLLPGWNIDLNSVTEPMKSHLRNLGIVKLLYYYGGLRLPASYLALEDLTGIYDTGLENSSCFVGELINRNITSDKSLYLPSHLIMGCQKNSEPIKELMLYMEQINSNDFTNEQDVLGLVDRKCYELVINNKINMIDGKMIGVKSKDNKPIYIDTLLGSSYINYIDNLQGIYIPDREILLRTKYEWFVRMSPKQIYESEIILAKYLLISNEL